ncbi:MAG: nitroreductase [Anaerolineae bacterium]|nr:MAG: nitroreductase [Anaerolineae bacterium]
MDALEAIHTRQSIGDVRPDPVPREMIERLLDAAVQAPNHFRVRPWRFVVLTGAGRERLGRVLAESLKRRNPDVPEVALEKEASKPLRAPVVIAVGVDKPTDARLPEIENVCAVAAACQNLLLAAHALGLAAKWRTGGPAYDPMVKEFLGFQADQHLIAFLYIGYPVSESSPPNRPGFEDRVTWME